MSVFFALTRNTFRECLRERVFFLILASTLLLIISFPVLTFFAFHMQAWAVLESSMAAILVMGFLAAVICSNASLRQETQTGTLLLLLSKPVSRFTFLLAKVAGIAGAMVIFVLICGTAAMTMTLTTVSTFNVDTKVLLPFFGLCAACFIYGGIRNYYSGVSFSENTIYSLLLTTPLYYLIFYLFLCGRVAMLPETTRAGMVLIPCSELLPAMFLLLLAIMLMAMISTALALRFSFLTNLICCFLLFLMGLVANPWIREQFGSDSFIGNLLCTLIPNWQHFWMAYPLSKQIIIPAGYVGSMIIYVICYGALWITWAGVSFQCAELAKDSRT